MTPDQQDGATAPDNGAQAAPKHSLLGLYRKRAANSRCYNVLFVCSDNSISGIFAEALLKRWGEEGFRSFSAGCHPAAEVHPLAMQLMKLQRVWRQELRPKGCHEFQHDGAPKMDFVITIGERVPEGLPSAWPGNPRLIHWHISEPMGEGTPAQRKSKFIRTLTELETRIKLFVLIFQKEAARGIAA